jgi:hypothetical protein
MQRSVEIRKFPDLTRMDHLGRPELSNWFFCVNHEASKHGIAFKIRSADQTYAPFGAELVSDDSLPLPESTMPAGGVLISDVKSGKDNVKLPDVKRVLDRALRRCEISLPEGTRLTSEGVFVSSQVLDAMENWQRTHSEDNFEPLGAGSKGFTMELVGGLKQLCRVASRA